MTQPIIKLLLLAAIAVIGWYALRGATRPVHRIIWRGFVVLILVAGVVSTSYPQGLTWIANKVGVGRGSDLLLYILVVTFGLVSVILFRRLDALERRYIDLARSFAIQEAARTEASPSVIRNDSEGNTRE
jgi:hypothetical protein